MKRKLLCFLIAFPFFTLAQVLTIPDSNFKLKLLQALPTNGIAKNGSGTAIRVDSNANGEIETSEAAQVFQLDVSNTGSANNAKIVSLNGIHYFTNLRVLNCNDNLLTTLSVTSLPNLNHLGCQRNKLTNLQVQNSSSLQWLDTSSNLLTGVNTTGINTLVYLDVSNNQLITFNGLTNPLLSYLNLSQNPLNSLTLGNLNQLTNLNVSQTELIAVDTSLLPQLSVLNVSSNPHLKNLNLKNGSFESGLTLNGTPNLAYICTDMDALEITSTQYLVATYSGSSSCSINTYCSFIPGGTTYSLSGEARYDLNNNGYDSSDLSFSNYKVTIASSNESYTHFPKSTDNTFSTALKAGTYTVSPSLEQPDYFVINPSSVAVNFPTNGNSFQQNFSVSPNGTHHDLEIFIIPLDYAMAGYPSEYKVVCKNKGTHPQNATVNLNFNAQQATLYSAIPAASIMNGSNLQWTALNLQPFESKTYLVKLILNAPTATNPLNAGDIFTCSATINGLNDVYPNDNQYELKQTVVNSMDPNFKFCLEGTTISPEKVGDYVHYMIRFENLGNAAARNIVITDIIETSKLEIGSIVVLDASHAYDIRIQQFNQIEFIFENINLPYDDANNDGYIVFKIRTKSVLALGDTFSNTASIYFDYNLPITTNTYTTTVQALNQQEFTVDSLSIAPNPTTDWVTIHSKEKYNKAEVYDIEGRLTAVFPVSANLFSVSSLQHGSYLLKLYTDNEFKVVQLLKK